MFPVTRLPYLIQHSTSIYYNHGEREESDKKPVEVKEHREDSNEEPDEYEELSVKSDTKYENGGRREED